MRTSLMLALGLMAGALGACSKAGGTNNLAAGSEAAPACSATKLPITGVCRDASAAHFVMIDPSIEIVAQGCVWRTEELQTKPDEALVFRAQDCTGEKWDPMVYSWVGNYVKARLSSWPEDQANFILEVQDAPAGETPENVAMKTLAAAPEDQRERCVVTPLPEIKMAGRAFELAPNAELEAELTAAHPNEPWEACGPNGVSMDGIQFWEARDTRALFHMVGQDEPLWDPASFTFYVRQADGSWRKAG